MHIVRKSQVLILYLRAILVISTFVSIVKAVERLKSAMLYLYYLTESLIYDRLFRMTLCLLSFDILCVASILSASLILYISCILCTWFLRDFLTRMEAFLTLSVKFLLSSSLMVIAFLGKISLSVKLTLPPPSDIGDVFLLPHTFLAILISPKIKLVTSTWPR